MSAADIYRRWAGSGDVNHEQKTELLRDADTYDLEAMYIFKSIGLGTKSKECETRIRKGGTQLCRKKKSRFINIDFDESWLYLNGIVAKSPKMRDAINKTERLASSCIPVFITGETGTGKEIVARPLHQLSDRSSGAFIPVNCAAIADTVFESELFGHKKGSFTGAISDRVGLIELASGGTLFLDEISELTDRQQAKLLRALEEGSIRRVGETKERTVNVKVVSASNGDIGALLDSGRLRMDFFFRISVERIDLAP
jgi:transcriptional regulator with PAS, ATPase and Fis domain